jgi:hypothetical protein
MKRLVPGADKSCNHFGEFLSITANAVDLIRLKDQVRKS